jgi:hypothetical protein
MLKIPARLRVATLLCDGRPMVAGVELIQKFGQNHYLPFAGIITQQSLGKLLFRWEKVNR